MTKKLTKHSQGHTKKLGILCTNEQETQQKDDKKALPLWE